MSEKEQKSASVVEKPQPKEETKKVETTKIEEVKKVDSQDVAAIPMT